MRVGSILGLLLLSGAIALCPFARSQNLSSLELKNDQNRTRKFSGEWKLELGGTSFQEGKDEGAAAYTWLSSNLQLSLTKWLKVEVDPRLSFYSSRVQERYDDDTFQNRIWLSDAHVSLMPNEFFEIRGGALNQGYHGSSVLVSSFRSFPGIQEIAKVKAGDVAVKLIAQQAVPSSSTLNTEREKQEKRPTFNTETLALSGKHFDVIEWKANGGHFKWANLPSKIAWESRRLGALGAGEEIPSATFLYEHEGWFANAEVCYCTTDTLGFTAEFQRIQNTKAPSHAADSQLLGIGPNIKFGDKELVLRYRNYFTESDATIAVYSKGKYGNTNRIGESLLAELKFKKYDFTMFVEAYRAQTINPSEAQRDLSIYLFGVETDYASF